METAPLLLYIFIFIIAFLYSSVGHGGASGYLAIMALTGFAPEQMKPTALLLNIIVSAIAFIQYSRSGFLLMKLFIPLVLSSVPFAFLGGITPIADKTYKIILGVLLIWPAIRFLGIIRQPETTYENKKSSLPIIISLGAVIGYVSGLTGIGGGIVLSPILLLLRWTSMKETAAISAGFILLNSISGIGGLYLKGFSLETNMTAFIFIALLGGMAGSFLGAKKFNPVTLSRILGSVLLLASLKLLFIQ